MVLSSGSVERTATMASFSVNRDAILPFHNMMIGRIITFHLMLHDEPGVLSGILGLVGRGFTTVVKPEFRDPATIADCANCHKCVDACPTGALKFLNK